MDKLSLHDPVFATYAVAASIMILKAASMSWLTIARMLQVNGGSFTSPLISLRARTTRGQSSGRRAPSS